MTKEIEQIINAAAQDNYPPDVMAQEIFADGARWALGQPELLENFAEWMDSNYTQSGNGWERVEGGTYGEMTFKEVFDKYLEYLKQKADVAISGK